VFLILLFWRTTFSKELRVLKVERDIFHHHTDHRKVNKVDTSQ